MKYLHILFVILFTGLFIANYYYISTSIKSVKNNNSSLLSYSLRFSFYIDVILFAGLIVIPLTCALLIVLLKLPFSLPWLVSAYWLCGIVSLAFLAILTIKLKNARRLAIQAKNSSKVFYYSAGFHVLNLLVILCLIATLHDAVFQQTMFGHGQAMKTTSTAYQWVKVIHIISASLLFGTGAGTAFYMFLVNFSGNISVIARATARVVIADWLFTASAGVIQAITGLTMVYLQHYSFTKFWVLGSIMGYLVAGGCWLPVIYLQIKCRDLAFVAEKNQQPLPSKYYRFFYTWCLLGIPAFLALLFVIYLMTERPAW